MENFIVLCLNLKRRERQSGKPFLNEVICVTCSASSLLIAKASWSCRSSSPELCGQAWSGSAPPEWEPADRLPPRLGAEGAEEAKEQTNTSTVKHCSNIKETTERAVSPLEVCAIFSLVLRAWILSTLSLSSSFRSVTSCLAFSRTFTPWKNTPYSHLNQVT